MCVACYCRERDRSQQPPTWSSFAPATGTYKWHPDPVTEDDIRRIIREEMVNVINATTPPKDL